MSNDLTLPKAVLITALIRPEPPLPTISRDSATLFARAILRTCNVCSAANVKICTTFAIQNIFPSTARTTALIKFLAAASRSFPPKDANGTVGSDGAKESREMEGLAQTADAEGQQPPHPSFKRLHLLFLIHDILLHCQTHPHARGPGFDLLRSEAGVFAEMAACSSTSKTATTIQQILALWKSSSLFPPDAFLNIQTHVDEAKLQPWPTLLRTLLTRYPTTPQTAWILPQTHTVIPSHPTPWHHLPATNGLFQKRTLGSPLRASLLPPAGYPVPGGGAEADPELQSEVEGLYRDVLRCFEKYTKAEEVEDVDAVGNVIWKDGEGGDGVREVRNHWGFRIEKVQRRRDVEARFAGLRREGNGRGWDGNGRGWDGGREVYGGQSSRWD